MERLDHPGGPELHVLLPLLPPEPLQRFHDGAFRLAIDTAKPILPAVIFYTKKVLPGNKTFYFWPHKVEMHFLPPIDSLTTVEELKNKTFEIMKAYFLQHQ
jgi:1-acyl-sn-glycerol-3-phosphate acyltransferase